MIHGRRVALRTMEEADLASVKAINDDQNVRGNVVGWAWPTSMVEMAAWFQRSHGGPTHRWVVVDEQDRVLGVTGLWDVDLQSRNALTALKMGGGSGERGKGAGTDSIMITMAFAFYDVGLHRLYGAILRDNVASTRAYVDKCGWTVEGVSRQHVWRHGCFVDLQHVGILKEEFDSLPDAAEYVDLIVGSKK